MFEDAVQPHSFELEEDASSYASYARGGIVTQFKRPKQLAFKPLQQAIESPGEFLFSDFSKIERPGLLHIAFLALDAFQVIVRSPGSAHWTFWMSHMLQCCRSMHVGFRECAGRSVLDKGAMKVVQAELHVTQLTTCFLMQLNGVPL